MTKGGGGGGQKSQKIDDVFYERPLRGHSKTRVTLDIPGGGEFSKAHITIYMILIY